MQPPDPTESIGVILLAAGYGTRLQRDMKAIPQFHPLSTTPKPLLPLAGRPILDHWLEHLASFKSIASIVVITNAVHKHLYDAWADSLREGPLSANNFPVKVVSDGSTDNASRQGAVADIGIALSRLKDADAKTALIIAGDTLLPDTDLHSYTRQFCSGEHQAATFAYPLSDMADCKRRGMFSVKQLNDVTIATRLVEKPSTPDLAPSNLASAPIYFLRRALWHTISEFLQQRQAQPLETRDAPGYWLGWLLERHPCRLFTVQQRIDIGGLQHYKDALWELTVPTESVDTVRRRRPDEPAVGRAYPRVGLLGNPSDGYGGKVIALAIASEGYAEVVATPADKFSVTPNPAHELSSEFDGLGEFLEHVESRGVYFGARTLIVAACVIFSRAYKDFREAANRREDRPVLSSLDNCELSYLTSIPARVGLSGSSALILATLRALARFHGTTLEEICPDISVWPELMRSAEADLLGISCGLQDRVAQVMQGCVWMDFTEGKVGNWERLPESKLPEMWLAYCEGGRVGECSGKVHGNLRARYERGDPRIMDVVQSFCNVVDEGRMAIEAADFAGFPALINRNFELRRELVGDTGIGETNKRLVSVARLAGFAAKMSGSGGCALCVPDPIRVLSEADIESAKRAFAEKDMVLRKVKVLNQRPWQPRMNEK